MKSHLLALRALALVALVAAIFPCSAYAGLYGDGKDQTTGDLDNQDYWWSRYDDMMLDKAIQLHEPEGRIGINVAIAQRRLDDLSAKFPKHEEIKKMKAHFDDVASHIDPNASRSESFSKECPWDEANFAQLWVNLHWAQSAYKERDFSAARSCLQNVEQNYGFLLAPGRTDHYPDDLKKWLVENKPVADQLYAEVKKKM